MTRMRRSACAVLPLVLKGRWYDMIASGKKREEYRAATEYWRIRLDNWNRSAMALHTPVVEFRSGYAKDAARMAFRVYCSTMDIKWCHSFREEAQHPEWGEPASPHFAIRLGVRVELED